VAYILYAYTLRHGRYRYIYIYIFRKFVYMVTKPMVRHDHQQHGNMSLVSLHLTNISFILEMLPLICSKVCVFVCKEWNMLTHITHKRS
jgi:hypothetical protein